MCKHYSFSPFAHSLEFVLFYFLFSEPKISSYKNINTVKAIKTKPTINVMKILFELTKSKENIILN